MRFRRVDRSVQTGPRAEPAYPEDGAASGASERDEWERFLAAVTDWERERYLDVLP